MLDPRSPVFPCTGSRGLPWPGITEWKLDRQQYLEWKRERQSRLDEVEQTRDGWQLLGGGGVWTLSPAAALRIWSAQSTVSQPVGVSVAGTTVGTPVGPLGILAMALIAVFAPADVPKWPSATPHATAGSQPAPFLRKRLLEAQRVSLNSSLGPCRTGVGRAGCGVFGDEVIHGRGYRSALV